MLSEPNDMFVTYTLLLQENLMHFTFKSLSFVWLSLFHLFIDHNMQDGIELFVWHNMYYEIGYKKVHELTGRMFINWVDVGRMKFRNELTF